MGGINDKMRLAACLLRLAPPDSRRPERFLEDKDEIAPVNLPHPCVVRGGKIERRLEPSNRRSTLAGLILVARLSRHRCSSREVNSDTVLLASVGGRWERIRAALAGGCTARLEIGGGGGGPGPRAPPCARPRPGPGLRPPPPQGGPAPRRS